jgi:hypothetical protein
MFLFKGHFKEPIDGLSHRGLDEPELLITLVSEDLSKQGHFMVCLLVLLHPINDSTCPLDDQGFQTVPLLEVIVHKSLHSFFALLVLFTFLVKFDLGQVHVLDDILELFEAQRPRSLLCLHLLDDHT